MMWRFTLLGAVFGSLLFTFGQFAVIVGPGPDSPGEATAGVFGVVLDRVTIPPGPEGDHVLASGRIGNGYLAVMAVAIATGGAFGAAVGFALGRLLGKRSRTWSDSGGPPVTTTG